MVQHHLDNDSNVALVGGFEEELEIVQRSVFRMHRAVIRNVVSIVTKRGREERHQPDGVDAQLLQIVELLRQSAEISVAVAATVKKSANVDLVDDRVLIPKRVLRQLFSPNQTVWRGHSCPRKSRGVAGTTIPV